MSNQAEIAFLRGSQPVTYANDYQQPPANSLRRILVLQPASTRTVQLRRAPHGLDCADQGTTRARVPPADIQGLLEGKALADNKLLREYSTKDGDTLNLLVKPTQSRKGNPSLSPSAGGTAGRGRQHIPSAVLSLSPSAEAPPSDLPSPGSSTRSRQNSTTRDITLTLDNATPALAEQELSTYHAGIANPRRACSRIWVRPPSSRGPVARVRGVPARGQGHAHRERERDACGVLAHEALPIVALYRSAPMLMALLPPQRPCALASAPATVSIALAPGARPLPHAPATVPDSARCHYNARCARPTPQRPSALAAATAPDCTRFRHSARRVRSRYSACSPPPAQYPRALVATTAPDALASTSRPTALAPRPSFRVRSLLLPRPMRSPHSMAPDDTPHHSHPTVRHSTRMRLFHQCPGVLVSAPAPAPSVYLMLLHISMLQSTSLYHLSAPSSTLIPASAFIVSTVRHAFVSLAPTNTLWLSCPRFPLQHHVFFFLSFGLLPAHVSPARDPDALVPTTTPTFLASRHFAPTRLVRYRTLECSPLLRFSFPMQRSCALGSHAWACFAATVSHILLPRSHFSSAPRVLSLLSLDFPLAQRTRPRAPSPARFRSRLPSYNPQPDRTGPYLILQRRRGLVGLSWPLRLYVASVSCTFECALATNYSFSALWVLLTATARVLPCPFLPQRLPASPLHLSVSVAAATVSLQRLHAPGHGSPSLTLTPPCELFRPSPHLVVIAKSSDRYLYPLFSYATAMHDPYSESLSEGLLELLAARSPPMARAPIVSEMHKYTFLHANTAESDSGFPRFRVLLRFRYPLTFLPTCLSKLKQLLSPWHANITKQPLLDNYQQLRPSASSVPQASSSAPASCRLLALSQS
ncbi:hypothetical protein C8J57DRAFT_1534089 [Mycena rebaudengoi]|nr:hypothetical protein C8J57DRAFT_1534089 [Mycena rebaudengoi]